MTSIINEGLIKQLVQRFFIKRRAREKTAVILHELLHETYAQGAAAANRAAAAAEEGRLAQQVVSPLSRPCSTVLTPLELWQARRLLAAGHDALEQAAGVQGDAEAELLDMLGRIHPMAMPREQDLGGRKERLTRAFARQQPWPVPDQACIVWRADLMRLSNDLTHKQAFFDHEMQQRKAVAATQQPQEGNSDD